MVSKRVVSERIVVDSQMDDIVAALAFASSLARFEETSILLDEAP